MNDDVVLRFESRLTATPDQVWTWITSVEGISAEIWPYFRMTVPKRVRAEVRSRASTKPQLGVRIFRSYIFLFGVLPIDYSDMTLLEFRDGIGFVEQSPMGSMKLWRHERHITVCADRPGTVLLVDRLRFRPRVAKRLVAWFIQKVFTHRHQIIRENLAGI